jgi:peptidyl-prolyl cis-trans isomerase B (cyclophilin B)
MKRKGHRLLMNSLIAALYIALAVLTGCSAIAPGGAAGGVAGGASDESGTPGEAGQKNPLALVEMDGGGKIEIELYPDIAPNTVSNFIALANSGFYDGVIFHRVIPGFMIQGGDPDGTGRGGPGYRIKGEFANNGYTDNDLKHVRGVISMARQGNQANPPAAYDTAGSQFFIMVADSPYLDSDYAAFGEVVSGMDVADEIVSAQTDASDKPLKDQKIKSIRVDTFGAEYAEPETLAE